MSSRGKTFYQIVYSDDGRLVRKPVFFRYCARKCKTHSKSFCFSKDRTKLIVTGKCCVQNFTKLLPTEIHSIVKPLGCFQTYPADWIFAISSSDIHKINSVLVNKNFKLK